MAQRVPQPTTYVIFGATGDLTRKLLVPALFSMYEREVLPRHFTVIGVSRRPLNDASFRKMVAGYLKHESKKKVQSFCKLFSYHQLDFTKRADYTHLREHLEEIDATFKICTSTLFHLAVPPTYYRAIVTNLSKSKLTDKCSDREGWTRVLIEKPFGKDLHTAQVLEKKISSLFKEKQIYRVDHYLAKEAMQNILSFRFSNLLFEPVWNAQYIERVDLTFNETIGIGTRGNFYDGVGALRDVGQNHMLQMLAVTAMENPGEMNADTIRKERAKIIKKLRVPTSASIKQHTSRGQYIGYTSEKHVKRGSKTDTYFKTTAFINSKRWKGVPFNLVSGKALHEKRTEISVMFKESNPCYCDIRHEEHEHHNRVIFNIEPEKTITVYLWAKKPGFDGDIEPREFTFPLYDMHEEAIGAYDKVIFDAISGNQTLFTHTDEITASWRFITPILRNWRKLPLKKYKKGSTGPR